MRHKKRRVKSLSQNVYVWGRLILIVQNLLNTTWIDR